MDALVLILTARMARKGQKRSEKDSRRGNAEVAASGRLVAGRPQRHRSVVGRQAVKEAEQGSIHGLERVAQDLGGVLNVRSAA